MKKAVIIHNSTMNFFFRIIVSLLVLIGATNTNAQTAYCAGNYYVDSVGGSDGNAGTSISTPFKNLTALPTISSFTTICLKNGSNWNGYLSAGGSGGSAVSNITFQNYGDGALPIIDASGTISAGSWTKTGGFTAVYNTGSLTFPTTYLTGGLAALGCCQINVFEDGAYLAYQTSQANVDACTSGCYTVSSHTTSAGTVYIRASDGSNPATNGKIYLYTQYPFAAQIYSSGHAVISGIHGKFAGANDGAIAVHGDGSAPYINNVVAEFGGKHTLYIPGGGVVVNSTVRDGYCPSANCGAGNLIVAFDQVGSSLPVTIRSTSVILNTSLSQNMTGIYGHTGSGNLGTYNIFDVQILSNNSAGGGGVGAANISSLNINGLLCSQLQSCVAPLTNFAIVGLRHNSNIVQNNAISLTATGVVGTVDNSKFCANNIQQGFIRQTTSIATTVSISNSLFYVGVIGSGNPSSVVVSAGTMVLTSNGNVFDAGRNGATAYSLNTLGNTYSGNNNSYPSTGLGIYNTVTEASLGAWQSATGQDAASITTGSGVAACAS